MRYENIKEGRFIERPNRFVAYVDIADRREKVHVKNTGRCRELLIPGAPVYLEKSGNPARSTSYDLIAVEKKGRLINMDSQAPNRVVLEWLQTRQLFPDLVSIRPETVYGSSRLDFYIETAREKIFMEVKGVTLEEEGEARFPDAPSERAVKHVEELIRARREGYGAYVLFVIQMKGVNYLIPNAATHPEFAEALRRASQAGVKILAYDCQVTADSLAIADAVPVYLEKFNSISENIKENLRKAELSAIAEPLLKWYDTHRRILPWREDPTPYHVWVSEIMLQQTRVEAVKPYYERFMGELPDIESLAGASQERLLKLWEGLGYYSRARNLQTAARQVVEEYGGELPDTREKLLQLKGIGSYTAGAIASIAYGKREPAVDGNVLRVLARLRMNGDEITDFKVKQRVENQLREAMSQSRPGDFNQAMMEIGAMVCIPHGQPHCQRCPLKELCLAHERHCEVEYPRKAAKKKRSIEKKTVLLIQDDSRVVLRRRPSRGLLAGMYEFPALEGYRTAEDITRYLADNGLKILRIRKLEDSRHIFSHKEWHMQGYMIRVDELEPKGSSRATEDWLYVEPEETRERYPIPSALATYATYLNIRQGKFL
ncbi:MAG: A/G-specific adenine glycosylase [Acetatifactor sp.]|nr:A/G-specific adenine glycosylase [Acetatifactor sp.]